MATRRKSDRVTEYGDFQTPVSLACRICALLARRNVVPSAIVEPTCGIGNFLFAAMDQFPAADRALAVDVNHAYIQIVRSRLERRTDASRVQTVEDSFFSADWQSLLQDTPDPLLVIGNPPWVTTSELCALGSGNLPEKSNFKNHLGLDALMGKSNFDISEWMLLQILKWLDGRNATMAMLCKTVVARKVLSHAWKHNASVCDSRMYLIDAKASFGASVDACLLVCSFSPSSRNHDTAVYGNIGDDQPLSVTGYRDGHVIADVDAYARWKHLKGGQAYRWRSGIKHDCAKVMELRKEGQRFRNGLHELAEFEEEYLYPMLKGSEIANGRTENPRRWMLVTQQRIGEDTKIIEERAPRTWKYLQSHAARLNRRASSIYRKRPQFSIFGVGDYSFAPWKIGVAGLYKKLEFRVIGSFAGKPIVLDDTCCFVPCQTEEEARYVASLLNSSIAHEFLSAFLFWDAKRPVTIEMLQRLDLEALARELGSEETIAAYLSERSADTVGAGMAHSRQLDLFGGD